MVRRRAYDRSDLIHDRARIPDVAFDGMRSDSGGRVLEQGSSLFEFVTEAVGGAPSDEQNDICAKTAGWLHHPSDLKTNGSEMNPKAY